MNVLKSINNQKCILYSDAKSDFHVKATYYVRSRMVESPRVWVLNPQLSDRKPSWLKTDDIIYLTKVIPQYFQTAYRLICLHHSLDRQCCPCGCMLMISCRVIISNVTCVFSYLGACQLEFDVLYMRTWLDSYVTDAAVRAPVTSHDALNYMDGITLLLKQQPPVSSDSKATVEQHKEKITKNNNDRSE